MAVNSLVYVKGTGSGKIIESLGGLHLIEFPHALAWVDPKHEEVQPLGELVRPKLFGTV